jgi:hypothetical protein
VNAKFFVTFGSQYRYEEHPYFTDAHPDGWVEIEAEDETQAREMAWSLFGDHWSFIYGDYEFANSIYKGYYPKGPLATVVVE